MNETNDIISLRRLGDGPVYEGLQIWLPQLAAEAMGGGQAVIEGKTFLNCRIEGPAVLLPVGGCEFDACDMGFSGGDPRNFLLSPLGPEKVIGAIAFRNCVFRGCKFMAVGFTGSAEFLKNFHSVVGGKAS